MPVKSTGIIYLERDKFQLYSPLLTGVLEFRFIPEIISDLDVINKELLVNIVKMFLTNSKLPPGNYVVVVADNAAFIKDFVLPPKPALPLPQPGVAQPPILKPKDDKAEQEKLQADVKQFIEHIPFDSVVSKNLPLPNGTRIFAVNQDLFASIKTAFEEAGSTIESVMPGIVYGNNLSAQPVITPQSAAFFLQRYPLLKQYNLLHQETFIPESKMRDNEPAPEEVKKAVDPKKTKKETIALSGILGVLVIVLVAVYMMTNTAPTDSVHSNAAEPTVAPVANNTVAPPVAQPTTQASIIPPVAETKNLSVQVISASDSALPAQRLQGSLAKYGFKSVTLVAQQQLLAKGIVLFAASVTPDVRAAIISELQQTTGAVQVQSTTTAPFDITITVGK